MQCYLSWLHHTPGDLGENDQMKKLAHSKVDVVSWVAWSGVIGVGQRMLAD